MIRTRLTLTLSVVAALAVGLTVVDRARTSAPPMPLPVRPVAVAGKSPLPAGARLTRIEAFPARIHLDNPFAYAQLVVTAHLASGEQIDVTRAVQFDVPGKLVKLSPEGLVRPVADGSAALKVRLEGKTIELPVAVKGQNDKYDVGFVQDVMPVLSRVGCNAGTCHGAEAGRNGFKLSLRGYDPLFDYRALTDDLSGRRFNRAAPDTSLMLLKTSGAVPHVGGALVQPGQPYYELLKSWIGDGVKIDLKAPRVKSIALTPTTAVIQLFGQKQQLAVTATYTDGKTRDVSAEAFLDSSNTEVATVDRQGTVTAVRRGETTVMARYEGAYAATTIIVMGDRSGFEWKAVPEFNYVDTLAYDKLRQVKVLPSDLCTDSEFIRRVYLDLIGLPPTPEQVRAFLADTRATRIKRDEMVDRLVGNEEFVEHWTNKWADLLQVNRKFLGVQGATAFRAYVRKEVAANTPYDRFVYKVLTGSGSNIDSPAASYFKVLRTPEAVMENTTQLFLGVRFNCNKCHDHPFERWTQDQYYQLSAYFARVGRAEDPRYRGQRIGGTNVEAAQPLVEVISDVAGGDVKHVRTNAIVPPAFPYAHKDVAPTTATRREQLAKWMTSKENQYFARSYVNRLWGYLLGVGLIEPIDDIRAGNPPTNPQLLDRLTEEFVKSGFDARHVIRTICKSRTYQHSVVTNRWNADDQVNYSHAIARRLPAEVLYDTIHRATGSQSHLPGLPAGARAALMLDSAEDAPGGFLDLFGKPARESACECERTGSMMLGPVLALTNGPVVADAIKDPNNRIARLLVKEKNDAKVIEELYLAVLCRTPTKAEVASGLKALKDGEEDYAEAVVEAKKHRAALTAYEQTLPAKVVAFEASMNRVTVWQPLEIVDTKSKVGATFAREADGSLFVTGKNAGPESYVIKTKTQLTGITAVRLEVLPDNRLPARGPGRAPNGNFVLNELKLSSVPLKLSAKPTAQPFASAQATFSQASWDVRGLIDNNPATGWAISPQFGKAQTALLVLKAPINSPGGSELTFTLDQQFAGRDHNIGKFRLSVTTSPLPLSLTGPPPHLAAIFAVEPARRTPAQRAVMLDHVRAQDAELARLNRLLAEHPMPVDKRHPGAQDLTWALINSKAFQFNH